MDNYLEYIRIKGRSLSEINPGSCEFALTVNDALNAIDILLKNKIAIVGGDILSLKSENLIYAYQLWGEKYHTLNWFCDKEEHESQFNYIKRSYKQAKSCILKADAIAKFINQSCFVVLII